MTTMKIHHRLTIALVPLAFALLACGETKDAPKTGAVVATAGADAGSAATEAPAAPAALPKIGDTIDIGKGATLTVESAAKNADGDLVVIVSIDNSKGTEKQTISSIMNFEAKDADGNKGQFAMDTSTGQLDGEVMPGDKLRGNVAFSGLGAGAKLYYKASLFSGDPIVIDLGQ